MGRVMMVRMEDQEEEEERARVRMQEEEEEDEQRAMANLCLRGTLFYLRLVLLVVVTLLYPADVCRSP